MENAGEDGGWTTSKHRVLSLERSRSRNVPSWDHRDENHVPADIVMPGPLRICKETARESANSCVLASDIVNLIQ